MILDSIVYDDVVHDAMVLDIEKGKVALLPNCIKINVTKITINYQQRCQIVTNITVTYGNVGNVPGY